jgi:hypothetical protein
VNPNLRFACVRYFADVFVIAQPAAGQQDDQRRDDAEAEEDIDLARSEGGEKLNDVDGEGVE